MKKNLAWQLSAGFVLGCSVSVWFSNPGVPPGEPGSALSLAALIEDVTAGSAHEAGVRAYDSDSDVYSYEFPSYRGAVTLPDVEAGNQTWPTHGRFVFSDAIDSSLIVVVQADASSGLLHGHGVYRVDTADLLDSEASLGRAR